MLAAVEEAASSGADGGLLGVVIGAGALFLAQLIAELVRFLIARSQRKHQVSDREAAARKAALERGVALSGDLRRVVTSYRSVVGSPSAALEDQMVASKTVLEAAVHQIFDRESRQAIIDWMDSTDGWINGNVSNSDEENRWRDLAEKCGECLREGRS